MTSVRNTLFGIFFAQTALAASISVTPEDAEMYPAHSDATIDSTEDTLFVSPARMASSFLDSPNAVTSLDVSTLRLLGITEIVDSLRLVPGMMVSESHGSDVSVGYHGANVNVPRRSEVRGGPHCSNSLAADVRWNPGVKFRLPMEGPQSLGRPDGV